MSRTRLALRALRLKLTGADADPTPDYDVASPTYDDYFTRVMGPHSLAMLDRVVVRPGDSVIELACGTGHLTVELARRLHGVGQLHAVDKSPGMLDVARAKLNASPDLDLSFAEDDMEHFLRSRPSASADLVVIGWAICYADPQRLLRQVYRVLRPGGRVAVIETRADALQTLRSAFEEVLVDDPSLLTALIRVALPRDEEVLGRWFGHAGLETLQLLHGAQLLPCDTAREAVDWVERSGAAAGFRDSFDMTREDEVRRRLTDALHAHLARRGGLGITHTFVVGVAARSVATESVAA